MTREHPPPQARDCRYLNGRSALSFDGDTTDIDLGPVADVVGTGNESFTVEGWLKALPATRRGYWTRGRIIGANALTNNGGCSGSGATLVSILFTAGDARELLFEFPHERSAGCQAGTDATFGPIDLGTWHHFAATFDATASPKVLSTFLDGLPVTIRKPYEGTGPVEWIPGQNLHIGGDGGPDSLFRGLLDEVRISDVVRYNAEFSAPRRPLQRDEHTRVLLHFDENGVDPRSAGVDNDGSLGAGFPVQGHAAWVAGLPGVDADLMDISPVDAAAGRASSGLFIELPTENLLLNPGFEAPTATTAWATGTQAAATPHFDAGERRHGARSLKLVATGGGATDPWELRLVQDITLPAATYTLSAHLFDYGLGSTALEVGGPVDANAVVLAWMGQEVIPAFEPVGGGWWRATFSAPAEGTGAFGIVPRARRTLLVDDVQLEALPHATTYADGTLGTGYAWAGTAHESSTRRAGLELRYPDPGIGPEGTVTLWFRPAFTARAGATLELPLWRVGSLSLSASTDGTNSVVRLRKAGPTSSDATSSVPVEAGRWHFVGATWDTTIGMRLKVDGLASAINTDTAAVVAGDVVLAMPGEASAGGAVARVRVYNRALGLTELGEVYRAR